MRKLGFFATVFGRNRDLKQCLLDNVTRACVANQEAATQLEDAITARLSQHQDHAAEIATVRRNAYRMAHKTRKGPKNPW